MAYCTQLHQKCTKNPIFLQKISKFPYYMAIASRMVRPCDSHGVRLRGFFLELKMDRERVVSFVDGFNLYHALDAIRQPHLKWLDLRKLFTLLAKPKSQIITQILFFSAYPTWKPSSYYRHRQ